MYVQPKTDFIYIPKYTDTSSYDRAIESAKRTISKLDKALDETSEALEITAKARDLAGAARDHNFAISKLNKNTLFHIAEKYNIPESEIKEVKKEELTKLPEDLKRMIDPEIANKILSS